jgi:hypothetical protein
MSGQDLIMELQSKVALLDKALQQLGNRGRTYAQAEQDYRVALAKKIAIEREKSTPVTIISDICRGDKDIALAKFQRDVAEITYDSAKEAINVYKLQIKVLENQIDREWRYADGS